MNAGIKKNCSMPLVCMTCDVEITEKKGLSQFRRILQLFDNCRFKGTFFFQFSRQNHHLFDDSILQSCLEHHECGLHIHWGDSIKLGTSKRVGLGSLRTHVIRREIEEGLEFCSNFGFRPRSFRGGGLCQTTSTLKLLKEYGFRVDSSVAARLNERRGYFQKHLRVPYRSWYFASKRGYDIPASAIEDRMGILEIPVTRSIPSFWPWFPFTLTPETPLFKVIVKQWLQRRGLENPLLITPIFHSWGESILRLGFDYFLKKLHKTIVSLANNRLTPVTLYEVYDMLK